MIQYLCVFLLKAKQKTFLLPVDICSEPVGGFSEFERILEAEKILHNFYGIDFGILCQKVLLL